MPEEIKPEEKIETQRITVNEKIDKNKFEISEKIDVFRNDHDIKHSELKGWLLRLEGELDKIENPKIGDVIVLSEDNKLPNSIKHLAFYLGDNMYLS